MVRRHDVLERAAAIADEGASAHPQPEEAVVRDRNAQRRRAGDGCGLRDGERLELDAVEADDAGVARDPQVSVGGLREPID